MTIDDLMKERSEYIEKLKELCSDGSMGGVAGVEFYVGICTIDKLIFKYFGKKIKFDYLEVLKKIEH